ncbi:phage major capsid protein [Pseudogemmobacter sonorensis]|uniref:phage major capsid protein n=1 Tax=Pseudogemmobacter sonorensis TaxID=2989681 RepID=UPI0036C3D814
MANPNWGEMVTATLAHRRKKTADAISKNNILMHEMRRRGRQKTIGGGRTISTPIMVGVENANFQWYVGREALNIAGQEVLTSAEIPWKQYACGVSISGLEMLMNDGEEQVIDMMAARVQHAEKTIVNQMHQSAHGDGTGAGGKEFGGLKLMVGETPGATYGGINSGVSVWWDNQRSILGAAPLTSNIYASMLELYLRTSRGTDKPNLIVSDNSYYATFSGGLQAQQRFMDKNLASAGFQNIMFEMVPVVADGGMGGFAEAGAMRFLNLDTIEIIMHKKRNNVVLGGPRRPLTEDSDTVVIAGMGNWICNNRMLNAVLTH